MSYLKYFCSKNEQLMYNFRMKNKKIKPYLKIIKQIELVRSKNNKNWMDLYRLAFEVKPEKAVKIIKRILLKDRTVTKLAQKLLK